MAKKTSGSEDNAATDFLVRLLSIDFGDVLEYVQQNYQPEEVFSETELDDWATENGYIKE